MQLICPQRFNRNLPESKRKKMPLSQAEIHHKIQTKITHLETITINLDEFKKNDHQ